VTADGMLITFSSLGFASVFLALIIGMTDGDPAKLVSSVSGITPGARKQARFEQLDELTRIADEAIEARRVGRSFTRADAGF
jgi:hypothetical protein